jgi:hypothetical protein
MKLLPNFQQADISLEKLEGYVLNDEHPEGMHKARVFREALNIERRHAPILAELIRNSLSRAPAQQRDTNEYGDSWTTWHEIVGLNAQSVIVTVAWMFKKNADQIPVLISCYIEYTDQEKLRRLFSLE